MFAGELIELCLIRQPGHLVRGEEIIADVLAKLGLELGDFLILEFADLFFDPGLCLEIIFV